jgi:hypothetical protein
MLQIRPFSIGFRAAPILAAALALGLSCAACDAQGDVRNSGAAEGSASQSGALSSPAALAMQLFPPTDQEGIAFAQITPKRPLDLSESGGRLGFVWGGPRAGSAPGSYYYPQDRDFDRSHTAEWYAAHAPDEIVYKCDRKSIAPLFTYAWGYYSPLDTANPAVRQYIFNTFILPQLRSGVKVIALDNVTPLNNGHRCGVYRNGQWVQLFSGESRDPAYLAALMDWIGWMARQVHAQGGLLALNARIDPQNVEESRKLIALADIWLDEGAFSRDCRPRTSDRDWLVKMQASQWGAARMPWVSLEKTCASPAEISDDEAQWVVGNFLLAKGSRSYLGAFHDGDPPRTELHYPKTFNPPVGTPQGPAFAIAGGGMARRFSRGLVVVNPSSTAPLDYTLPAGNWANIRGQAVSGRIALGPTSAAILLSR